MAIRIWEASSEVSSKPSFPKWRLIFSVFLPFAAGYYLAYLFRTINAAISPALAADFGLDAAETGLLASIYFLVFGLTQIPIGVLLDRLGPRRVQGVLLVIAAGGATLFGNASSFPELLVARAMIGLGVAGSLMAGLKAIVSWFPKERVALANGWMIMLGSLGAVTATAPVDWLLNYIGWRSLFEILTIGTLTVGGLIYMVVPEHVADSQIATSARKPLTLWSIYSDPRFLRVRTAFCDLHWIGLGAAVIVGFGLAYGCRGVRWAEPGYAHALYGCWPKSRSPAAWWPG